jgi:hypothetical protein
LGGGRSFDEVGRRLYMCLGEWVCLYCIFYVAS